MKPCPFPEYSQDFPTASQLQSAAQPVILRGVVAHWPGVSKALQGPQALLEWLAAQDAGQSVEAILLRPEENGRVFYNAQMDGFNFFRKPLTVSAALEQLARYSHFANPPSMAIQSAPLADCLPGVLASHRMPLLDEAVAPRIWIGNRILTPAHFDESCNIACVMAGRRRFTLLPPEQVGNLYIGPLDFAPTPTPISLADLRRPDLLRMPRLQQALEAAHTVELAPGDALYIPPLWWHQVESLADLNVLVNYWWPAHQQQEGQHAAISCLLHCLRHMGHLSAAEKQGWQALFGHYLFNPAP
ncbi:cupin-like domain-containing protein [Massilia sp. W12]|uniref:cupin-like domain-containing protein n=1 Tax=Massilia sp. W12 TaxID=3126507 RepID=UPI0030D4D6BA